MIEQAVILCGGKGSRLKQLTKKIPKPLLLVNKKPFIEYQIENLARYGVKTIFLLCCYKYNLFKEKYHKKKILNSQIFCFNENKPLGTGGGLLLLKKNSKNFFMY